VVLAGTPTFTVDFRGNGLIDFAVTGEVAERLAGTAAPVENNGQINVDGGRVLLTANAAAGVVDNVINMDGFIAARSVASRAGAIVLQGGDEGVVRVAGTFGVSGRHSGEHGGEVKVSRESPLAFNGQADVGTSNGLAGSILLDPKLITREQERCGWKFPTPDSPSHLNAGSTTASGNPFLYQKQPMLVSTAHDVTRRQSENNPSLTFPVSGSAGGNSSSAPGGPGTGAPGSTPGGPGTGAPGSTPGGPGTGAPGSAPGGPGTGAPGSAPGGPGTGAPGSTPGGPGTGAPGSTLGGPGTGAPGSAPGGPGTGGNSSATDDRDTLAAGQGDHSLSALGHQQEFVDSSLTVVPTTPEPPKDLPWEAGGGQALPGFRAPQPSPVTIPPSEQPSAQTDLLYSNDGNREAWGLEATLPQVLPDCPVTPQGPVATPLCRMPK